MRIFNKIVNAAINRIPLDASGELELVETILRRLPITAYRRLREQEFNPAGIIDIGAYEGHWTRTIRSVFSSPPILMIEARQEQKSALEQVCSEVPHVDYIISLLGRERIAAVPFHVGGTGSSIFAERSDAPTSMRHIAMRTLDDVVSDWAVRDGPLFLKLDIQGAELECLRGGRETLNKAEVVQLEVALLNYNEGAPQALEVISFMHSEGFAILDIAGFVRPNGINLVQLDILFARETSRLRPDFFHF